MIGFIKKRIKSILLVIIITILIIAGWQNFSLQQEKKQETAKVKRGTLEEKLTISGTIDVEEMATLRFQTSGRLTWVGVKEGDYVKKYQAIASLDQREVRKTLEKYLNTYSSERRDFDQTIIDDYKDKVITDAIKRAKEKAQFDLNSAVLDVELKNLAIEFSNLWTPIEGIVTKILAPYAGVNITPATAEFEIVNPKTVYFSANADQTEVVKLAEGKQGELVLDAYPDATVNGSIKTISFIPKSGETGTVYSVKFVFWEDNSTYKYRIGMGGDLTFILERKEDVLYLPIKFVKSEDGKKYVQVKQGNKMEKVTVEVGMETDNNIEITSGIKVNDKVYN
ncbi:efflux RND transporter periplasmic adaptor subunit [Candidatus Gottesmanbacteria bacterium]|nr:efflux RND transporter periplasmic adaptor subunit [Candidatus Gottesmanbacteria bacterium]